MDWIREWWPQILAVLTLAGIPLARTVIRAGLASRADLETATAGIRQAIADHREATTGRLDELEREHALIAAQMAGLPGKEDIHRLALAVEKLAGRIGTLDELLGRMDRTIDRHEQILSDAGRR